MNNKLYKHFAGTLQAYQNCIKTGNKIWEDKHEEKLNEMIDYLPHGSGIDSDVELDFEKSNPNKLIFNFSFHFMDNCGMYDGWIDYKLTVTPNLYNDFDLYISGRDKNYIKEYLYEIFEYALRQEIDY
jgi:hypothetical protein